VIYINDGPAATGIHLALFADDTYIYAMEKHKRRVLCKLQRALTAVISWWEHWNIKIIEEKFRAICFSRRLRVPDGLLHLYGPDIPFVNNVTYFGITFDKRMAWKHHIERTAAKALRTYVKTYSLIRCGCLSTNIKLTIYRALIRPVTTYGCPTWEYAADALLLKQQRL
jgi:hypothetical protein